METMASWQPPEAFARHPDVLACVVMLLISLCSLLSMKAFTRLTLTFTVLSGFVLMAFVCVGYFHVQPHNWTQPPGFFSHGVDGMLTGAALMMSVFAGVDRVAGAGQDLTKDPSRHVPSSLPLTAVLLFFLLLLPTSALTLSCSWQQLADEAPLARAFQSQGIPSSHYVLGGGALCGLLASALAGLFHGSRLLHCMACDGLLPAWLVGRSAPSLPVAGGLLTGLVAALLALVLEGTCLVEMSAIGTLLHFLVSALVVLCVRYHPDPVGLARDYSDLDLDRDLDRDRRDRRFSAGAGHHGHHRHHSRSAAPKLILMANGDLHVHYHDLDNNSNSHVNSSDDDFPTPSCLPNPCCCTCSASQSHETSGLYPDAEEHSTCRRVVHSGSHLLPQLSSSCVGKVVPDLDSWRTTRRWLLGFLLSTTVLSLTVAGWTAGVVWGWWWGVAVLCGSVVLLVVAGLGIGAQPESAARLHYKTPCVPAVPLLCVVLCSVLLAALPAVAWMRFAVWTALGLLVYFLYGVRHSIHHADNDDDGDDQDVLFDISNTT